MANNAVLLPVIILSVICLIMFAFIWWWFPRQWKKGVEMDNARVDEERLAMGRMTVPARVQGSETTLSAAELEGKETVPGAAPTTVSVRPFRYVPPPVTAY